MRRVIKALFDLIRKAVDGLTSVVVLGLFALLIACMALLTLLLTPFAFLWVFAQYTLGFGPKLPSQDVMDEYGGNVDALETGDIAFLNLYAASYPGFPDTPDDFIGSHWGVNAIDLGTLPAAQWALERCGDLNFYDDDGRSPLTAAIEREGATSLELVKLVVTSGADVNRKGTLDVTPLHIAAAHGSPHVVQYLLDQGADPLACEMDTYTPSTAADWAARTERDDIAEMLEAAIKERSDLD